MDDLQADKAKKWLALGLVGLGLILQLMPFYLEMDGPRALGPMLVLTGMLMGTGGLGFYAGLKERSPFWGMGALVPFVGAVLALAVITSDLLSTRPVQQQKRLGLGLVALGVGAYVFFLFAAIPSDPSASVPAVGLAWALPILGLACYARAKGRSVFSAGMGLLPIVGPLLGLVAIGLDDLLAKRTAPMLARRIAMVMFALSVPALILAIAIPNFLRYGARGPQSEARTILGGIFVAEISFMGHNGRYGNFDEIGSGLAGNSNRYTYRIDNSGAPGTVFPAKVGSPTPDNTVVHAGISADGQSFTATATANLDNDPTLDQWHVNDRKEGLSKADVNDVL